MLPPKSSSHHTTEPWQALAQEFKAKLSQLPGPTPLPKVTPGSRAQPVPVQSAVSKVRGEEDGAEEESTAAELQQGSPEQVRLQGQWKVCLCPCSGTGHDSNVIARSSGS